MTLSTDTIENITDDNNYPSNHTSKPVDHCSQKIIFGTNVNKNGRYIHKEDANKDDANKDNNLSDTMKDSNDPDSNGSYGGDKEDINKDDIPAPDSNVGDYNDDHDNLKINLETNIKVDVNKDR